MNRDQLLEIRSAYIEEIRKIERKQNAQALPWAKNVVATGIGRKITDGKVTDGNSLCLVVFVRKKIEDEYLQGYSVNSFLKNKLPQENTTLYSDVVELGSFQSIAGAGSSSPGALKTSLSIGADLSMTSSADHATLCTFVHKRGTSQDGDHFLSAQHGIDGHQGLFHLVMSGGDVIGRIIRESTLLPGDCLWEGPCAPNPDDHQIDAVVCTLLGKGFVPRFDLPGGGRLNPTAGDPFAYLDTQVRKASGAINTGYVHCTDVCATIDYPSETACLRGQFVIRHETVDGRTFAARGDSGSLIVTHAPDEGTRDRHTAIGMLIAVGDTVSLLGKNEAGFNFSIATPISRILDEFHLDLAVG